MKMAMESEFYKSGGYPSIRINGKTDGNNL